MDKTSHVNLGRLLLIIAAGCNPGALHRLKLEKTIKIILRRTKMTVVKCQRHRFSPDGLTATYILKESHLVCHTWPEHHAAVLELFCCHPIPQPKNLSLLLQDRLGAKKIRWSIQTISIASP
ncbi:MAG: S-adenosylmethionine decarboxylase [Elusimicrobia bacterium]|nr:S-adenosylmethionine decarboxylase [Elusimicrobiota bacterium]